MSSLKSKFDPQNDRFFFYPGLPAFCGIHLIIYYFEDLLLPSALKASSTFLVFFVVHICVFFLVASMSWYAPQKSYELKIASIFKDLFFLIVLSAIGFFFIFMTSTILTMGEHLAIIVFYLPIHSFSYLVSLVTLTIIRYFSVKRVLALTSKGSK